MLPFAATIGLFVASVGVSAQVSNESNDNTTIETLVKLHGIGMVAGWGIIIPFGISIALMCKSICPGRGYVYSHLSFMLIGLVVVIASLVCIIIHADGKWLNSFEPISEPHKIMGLIGFAALALNPFLAIFTPKEDSKWRALYNFAHGGAGFFVGLLPALAAMLIAVHFFPSMAKDKDRSQLILILMSALVGYILLLLAIYNIYPIRYHKSIPQPFKIPILIKKRREPEGNFEITPIQQEEDIALESSPDSTYRVVAMTISLTPLIVIGIAVMSYIALLD